MEQNIGNKEMLEHVLSFETKIIISIIEMTCCASKKHISCICKSQRTENMCQNFEKNMKQCISCIFDDKCPCLANQFEKSCSSQKNGTKTLETKNCWTMFCHLKQK